jgi:hypothetical protein
MESARIFFLSLGTIIVVITLLTNLFAITTSTFGNGSQTISIIATGGFFIGLAMIVIGLYKRGVENNYYI